VECVYRVGKVEALNVTPEAWQKDVEVMSAAGKGKPEK
jgi:hypothetical protein